MRYLFALLLLPSLAFADATPSQMPSLIEWAQAQWRQHNGMLYLRVPIGSGMWCFSRSTAGIAAKSDEWEYAAPQVVVTIPATLEQVQVCTDTLPAPQWVVAPNVSATDTPPTRPLKNAAMVNTWRIAVGLPCEAVMVSVLTAGKEYHWATNSAGQRGITVCMKQ